MSGFGLELDATSTEYRTGAELALELFTAATTGRGAEVSTPDDPAQAWRSRYRPILNELLLGGEVSEELRRRLSAFVFSVGELDRISAIAHTDPRSGSASQSEMTRVVVSTFRDVYLDS
jgi:hypothetical protein